MGETEIRQRFDDIKEAQRGQGVLLQTIHDRLMGNELKEIGGVVPQLKQNTADISRLQKETASNTEEIGKIKKYRYFRWIERVMIAGASGTIGFTAKGTGAKTFFLGLFNLGLEYIKAAK